MQVRVDPEPTTVYRVQRDGPSPAQQAQMALQQELAGQASRISAEINQLTRERARDGLSEADHDRLATLRQELGTVAGQLRELETARREQAIEDAALARAENGIGATILQPPRAIGRRDDRIPPEAVDISIAFFVCTAAAIVLFPLMRSLGRILERRAVPPQRLDADTESQLHRMEQAIEAVSIEVERIAEGQRYTAKLLTDREKVGH